VPSAWFLVLLESGTYAMVARTQGSISTCSKCIALASFVSVQEASWGSRIPRRQPKVSMSNYRTVPDTTLLLQLSHDAGPLLLQRAPITGLLIALRQVGGMIHAAPADVALA
jgi:hypothetical protein